LRGNNGKTNEDRPVLSAAELYPTKCTFQQCIDYVDIAERSSARSRQLEYSGQKWEIGNGNRKSHIVDLL